jgi:excisionase family DNA binding protein
MTSTISPPAESTAKLLDVRGVAGLLGCSARHVYRLSDAGRMPVPVKLGSLVRWNRAAVEDWIAEGCLSCRKGTGR